MRKKLLFATTKGLSFRSNRNFTPKSNHLFYEVCYSADPPKFQQRGWSHAASVPSEEPEAPKGQKRVPRHQRRAMVESFVNKYRAENAGKFPKISDTQKQVGGSYYVIREIVLELEYESKMNSSNSVDKFFVGKKFDESKLLTTEPVNVPSGNIEIAKESPVKDDSQSVVLDDKESVNTGYDHLEEKREPQTSYLERRVIIVLHLKVILWKSFLRSLTHQVSICQMILRVRKLSLLILILLHLNILKRKENILLCLVKMMVLVMTKLRAVNMILFVWKIIKKWRKNALKKQIVR
ncbi:hypothetical protein AAZX31_16G186600 [Glycine max]